MKVLFLTATTGGGHVKAAQALIRQMEKQLPDCGTILVDALKYISPLADRIVTGTYLHIIKAVPGLYGRFYDMSEAGGAVTGLIKSLNGLLSNKFRSLFRQVRPDVVVCAHTIPLQMMASLKRKGFLNAPLLGIVTDFAGHSFWKLDEVDAFIVAHEEIRNALIRMGLREDRVYAYGMPVSSDFMSRCDRKEVRKCLGFKEKPTLLLMGGSLGYGELEIVFKALLNLRLDVQIIAVAGCNSRLKTRLEGLSAPAGENVKIFGYTDKIHELMDASDLLITKPGGITISEALVKGLPILMSKPIPGQEERNAAFLESAGAAVRLHSYENLETILAEMLENSALLQLMSEASAKIAKYRACEDISNLVEKLALSPAYSGSFPVAIPFAANMQN